MKLNKKITTLIFGSSTILTTLPLVSCVQKSEQVKNIENSNKEINVSIAYSNELKAKIDDIEKFNKESLGGGKRAHLLKESRAEIAKAKELLNLVNAAIAEHKSYENNADLKTKIDEFDKFIQSVKARAPFELVNGYSKYLSENDYAILTYPSTMNKVKEVLSKIAEWKKENISKNELLVKVSNEFMNVKYTAERLIGSPDTAEILVVDLDNLDCFTYLDYIYALVNSTTEDEFIKNLVNTRYVGGKVSYNTRKHFFTDWASEKFSPTGLQMTNVIDKNVIGADKVTTLRFNRNIKASTGKEVLVGAGSEEREISYINYNSVTDALLYEHFKEGDIITLAAPSSLNDWLDVTHCGLLVFKDEVDQNGQTFKKAYYRNASSSSKNMKVVDTPLVEYLQDRNINSKESNAQGKTVYYDPAKVPGILIYRAV